MTAWIAYAAATVTIAAVVAGLVSLFVGPDRSDGAWLAALVAVLVQLPAFGALVSSRLRGRDFMVSWGSGMLLRFAVIAGAAFWVTRRTSLDGEVTLLSLVGMMFLLVLLEPVFLRLAEEPAGASESKGPERTSED